MGPVPHMSFFLLCSDICVSTIKWSVCNPASSWKRGDKTSNFDSDSRFGRVIASLRNHIQMLHVQLSVIGIICLVWVSNRSPHHPSPSHRNTTPVDSTPSGEVDTAMRKFNADKRNHQQWRLPFRVEHLHSLFKLLNLQDGWSLQLLTLYHWAYD